MDMCRFFLSMTGRRKARDVLSRKPFTMVDGILVTPEKRTCHWNMWADIVHVICIFCLSNEIVGVLVNLKFSPTCSYGGLTNHVSVVDVHFTVAKLLSGFNEDVRDG